MPLIAYDAEGNVVATEDWTVWVDPDGRGHLIDVEAFEADGGKLRDLWFVPGASGSATWPEWLGDRMYDFRVGLDGRYRLRCRRLVHVRSGIVRERRTFEREFVRRRKEAKGRAVDIRDLVGGPGRPLDIDDDGRLRPRRQRDPERRPVPRFLRHAVRVPEVG